MKAKLLPESRTDEFGVLDLFAILLELVGGPLGVAGVHGLLAGLAVGLVLREEEVLWDGEDVVLEVLAELEVVDLLGRLGILLLDHLERGIDLLLGHFATKIREELLLH